MRIDVIETAPQEAGTQAPAKLAGSMLPYAASALSVLSVASVLLRMGTAMTVASAATAAAVAALGGFIGRAALRASRGGSALRVPKAMISTHGGAVDGTRAGMVEDEVRAESATSVPSMEDIEARLRDNIAAEREAARAKGLLAYFRLRFADAVMAKVPVMTEEAAFALMDRLMAIRDQSAKASDAAFAAEEGDNSAGAIEAIAADARATMARVRAALSEMKKNDKETSKELQTLGQELTEGIELLTGIGDITERSSLIAVNMAIEAARIGEKGRGFKVIVGELRALNTRTVDFSKQVITLLDRFRTYNQTLLKTATSSSALVTEAVEQGIGEEEKAIESLLRESSSCVDLSDNVTVAVKKMNLELDGILESLQFQDITRQMVEGALATIAEAREDIALLSRREDGITAMVEERKIIEQLRSQLLARAKTKGEKEAIQEVQR